MSAIPTTTDIPLTADRITQSVIIVSSATARRWLDKNARNRPLSAYAVERYRRDMIEGRWVYAADPIRFDTDGNLLDGQHRLTALATCEGLALPFLVVRGLPTETQMVMDQGRKRSTGQQLAIKGVKNASNVAAAAKVYILWREGYLFRDNTAANTTVTTPRIEAWVDEHTDLVNNVGAYFNAIRSNDAPPSVAFAAALRFAQIHPDQAHAFFLSLANGGTPVKHPVNTLDKRLQRIRRDGLKIPNRDYLAMFVQAWNAVRDGKTLSQLLRPAGGKWTAENFPEPR